MTYRNLFQLIQIQFFFKVWKFYVPPLRIWRLNFSVVLLLLLDFEKIIQYSYYPIKEDYDALSDAPKLFCLDTLCKSYKDSKFILHE